MGDGFSILTSGSFNDSRPGMRKDLTTLGFSILTSGSFNDSGTRQPYVLLASSTVSVS